MKINTDSKKCLLAPLEMPSSVIGQCSTVSIPHWMQGKLAKIYLSQPAFRRDFSGSLAVFYMRFLMVKMSVKSSKNSNIIQ